METTRIQLVDGNHVVVKGSPDQIHSALRGTGFKCLDDEADRVVWISTTAVVSFTSHASSEPIPVE